MTNKKTNFDLGLYNESVVLIIGAPRSGTTLFSAMLSAHPDCCILMEDYFGGAFRILSKKITGVKLCTPNQITYENNKVKTKLKKLLNIALAFTLGRLGVQKKFNIPSAYSISDYIERADNLKLIYIARNPVDAIRSESSRNNVSIDFAKKQWIKSIEIYKSVKNHPKMKDSTLCIEYEKMVKNPKATMEDAFEFLEVDYTEKALEGYKYTPQYKGRTGIEVKEKELYNNDTNRKFSDVLDAYSELVLR